MNTVSQPGTKVDTGDTTTNKTCVPCSRTQRQQASKETRLIQHGICYDREV